MLLGKLAVSNNQRVGVERVDTGGVRCLHVFLESRPQSGEEAHCGQLLVLGGVDVGVAVVHLEAHLGFLVHALDVEFLVELYLGAQCVFHLHSHGALYVVPVGVHL